MRGFSLPSVALSALFVLVAPAGRAQQTPLAPDAGGPLGSDATLADAGDGLPPNSEPAGGAAASSADLSDAGAEPAAGAEVEPPPPRPTTVSGSVGFLGGSGFAPSPSAGAQVQVELRQGSTSLMLGVRDDLPAGSAFASGAFHTFITVLEGGPCLQDWILGACVIVMGGPLTATFDHVANAHPGTFVYAQAGLRGFGELPLSARWRLRLTGEVLTPLVRTLLKASDTVVYGTPSVAGDGQLSLVFRFH